MSANYLILDPGSSSLKFGLLAFDNGNSLPRRLATGIIERLGTAEAHLTLEISGQAKQTTAIGALNISKCTEAVLSRLKEKLSQVSISAIGCRIVHGGNRFAEPVRVTPEVIDVIRSLSALAPLHNPAAADVLRSCLQHIPDTPAFAVFDTAFHRTMPAVARTYAIPYELCEEHHRFGFHGIAHRYVSSRLIENIGMSGKESRCITCHLGSGASICAVRNGESVDTSMGMTPLEGIVMGTRSGDVDPGLLLELMRSTPMSVSEMDEMLNSKSGLLGISGISSDVRDLGAAAEKGNGRAELALELFAYRAAKTIGAYTVALEGLDAIAFSGGIGEHSASMRKRICSRLTCLGVHLDETLNNAATEGDPKRISAEGGSIQVWVIPADEELQIAHEIMPVTL